MLQSTGITLTHIKEHGLKYISDLLLLREDFKHFQQLLRNNFKLYD